MSKRFTETEKWRDPWFRTLNPVQKCLFFYCYENCNNAGFIEIDLEAWAFPIACSTKEIEGAWQGLGRGLIVSAGWAFVRNFLKHQKHLPLVPERNPAHKQIVALFHEQESRFPNLLNMILQGSPLVGAKEGLDSPPGKGIGKGIGNGEGKGKAAKAEKPPRSRNLLMDALASLEGDINHLPNSMWGKVAKALSEIKTASSDVTPEEIARRAKNYKTHMPDALLTCTALAAHWARCANAQTNQPRNAFGRPVDPSDFAPDLGKEERERDEYNRKRLETMERMRPGTLAVKPC